MKMMRTISHMMMMRMMWTLSLSKKRQSVFRKNSAMEAKKEKKTAQRWNLLPTK